MTHDANLPAAAADQPRRRSQGKLEALLGGAARMRVVLLLAGVLSLTSADMAAVGAMATQLESGLHVTNTDIGLLVTVSSGIGALTTLPFGVLADRVNRINLLVISIVIWSVAMLASAAAQSFLMLLLFRLALGAAIAAAGPLVASLTGDLFDPAEPGRIYGFILAGELVGAGFGGQSRLAVGATRIRPADEASPGGDVRADPASGSPEEGADDTELSREVEQADIAPHEERVLHCDPGSRSIWWAVRYVLSVRTNVVLIIASSLGYFFVSGLRTFAIAFAKARFGLGQGEASLLLILIGAGTLLGILAAGRISDALIARHHITARPLVGALAFLLAALLFVPGLLTTSLLVAIPLLFFAAAGVGGATRRWTRPGWTSCTHGCGDAPKACAPYCAPH